MSEHAILAPSAAERWVNCSGSVPLEAQCADDEKSQDELNGDAAHHIGAEYLRGWKRNTIPLKAAPSDVTPNGVIVTEEMCDAVDIYVDEIRDRCGHSVLEVLHIEEYQPIPHVHTDNGGTPDVWWAAINPGLGAYLHVWDFKYGHRFVDAFENWQLIDYAIGIVGRAEFAGIPPDKIEIELGVVQPRNYQAPGPVRTWKLTAFDLLDKYFTRLQQAAINARSNAAQCSPGFPQCLDCRARSKCRALQQVCDAALDYAASAVIQELPPEALGTELYIAETLGKLLDARVAGMQEQAAAIIKKGGFVPGFEVTRDVAREKWTMDPETIIAMGQAMGSVDLRKPVAVITPNQARQAGLDAKIVAGMSERPAGPLKLKRTDTSIARKVFAQ